MTLANLDVIAFVSTTDPTRAEKFYADALGLQLVNKSPFALVFDARGTMLRVTIVEELHPAPNTVLGWAVADVSETARALAARGVVFLRYDGMKQNDQGIWQSPSGALIAWFMDRLSDACGPAISSTAFLTGTISRARTLGRRDIRFEGRPPPGRGPTSRSEARGPRR